LDKTGKYGRIASVKVAHFSTHEMAHFSTIADTWVFRNLRVPDNTEQDDFNGQDLLACPPP
ncbi:hypothetical protein, partial [Pseudarthrobacter defluvii]|uniref:hypothetical protein n=1 Tax=Pseudarthrobacter defluvii TaxID=410837 RepID=UPI0027D8BF53